jgi:hypothetical protein
MYIYIISCMDATVNDIRSVGAKSHVHLSSLSQRFASLAFTFCNMLFLD